MITFDLAFRVLAHQVEQNEEVSNRDILEEVLRISAKNLQMTNGIFYQTFDEDAQQRVPTVCVDIKKKVYVKAQDYVDGFLSGKN